MWLCFFDVPRKKFYWKFKKFAFNKFGIIYQILTVSIIEKA